MGRLFIILLPVLVMANGNRTNLLKEPYERVPYSIPLPKLSLSFDKETGRIGKVYIRYKNQKEEIIITRYDDTCINHDTYGQRKKVYQESFHIAKLVSSFEAEHLNRVCKSFVSTLQHFEKNLRKENWGKCVYLDGFFPRFLRGFYYLVCTSYNSPDALPVKACVQESDYDVSLHSPKSDGRIQYWRVSNDYAEKLRTVTKKLIREIRLWQKNDLRKSKHDPEIQYEGELKDTFTLFVQMYLCKNPSFDLTEKN